MTPWGREGQGLGSRERVDEGLTVDGGRSWSGANHCLLESLPLFSELLSRTASGGRREARGSDGPCGIQGKGMG